MKIELDVSIENEGTASPWWVIIDPRQSLETKSEDALHRIAGMVDGPFFSRQAAQNRLIAARHNYGENAQVFCMSGCYARQYDQAYRTTEREEE